MKSCIRLLFLLVLAQNGWTQVVRRSPPDKLVVLTFDDASSTHATVVAPDSEKVRLRRYVLRL